MPPRAVSGGNSCDTRQMRIALAPRPGQRRLDVPVSPGLDTEADDRLAVDLEELMVDERRVVMVLHRRAPVSPHLVADVGALHQLREPFGQRLDVVLRHEEARPAVHDYLRDAAV